jgi:hypothetical protein
MKRLTILSLVLMLAVVGCNLEKPDHSQQMNKMEDTLFKAFPTVNRVSIQVEDDPNTVISITLGDKELYNASEQEQEEVAGKAALITQHVFAPDIPEKGSVIFVNEENTIVVDEASKKTVEMRFTKPDNQ